VPKKNGKWRICVNYRELNKATKKDHFLLPFIDQVLDGLAGKIFFSFLDGFSGYNLLVLGMFYARAIYFNLFSTLAITLA